MADPFVHIFRFFSRRKKLFFAILLLLLIAIGWAATKIRFAEDISGTVSSGDQDIPLLTLKNIRISDRLIIMIKQEDSTLQPDPDLLIEMGGVFVGELTKRADSSLIRDIFFSVSDSAMDQMTDLIRMHLPSFLDELDYRWLDSVTRPGSIHLAMKKNYQLLATPAGMVLKNRIGDDPLGIMNRAFIKLKSLQAGDDFSVYNGCIVTPDYRYLLIFIDPVYPASETSRNDVLVDAIDKTINSMESTSGKVKASYFGGPAIAVANARQLKRDILITLSIAILMILLLVGLYFRSVFVPVSGLLPALFGGGLALAILAFTKGSISAISLGIGSVILGLIVDYSLYIVNQFIKRKSMESAVHDLSLTIILCAFTSAGAFLCLTFLQSSVLHDLGWFAAISVLGAAVFALVVIPHLLPVSLSSMNRSYGIRLIDKIAGINFAGKSWLVLVMLIILLVSAIFSRKAGFLENMSSLSFMTPELIEAEAEINTITNYSEKSIFVVSSGYNSEKALQQQERIMPIIDSLQQAGIISSINNAGPLLLSDSIQQVRILRWNAYWNEEKKRKVFGDIAESANEYRFNREAFSGFFHLLNHSYAPFTPAAAANASNNLTSGWLNNGDKNSLAATILKVPEKDMNRVYKSLPSSDPYTLFDRQSLTNRFVERVREDFDLLVKLSILFVTSLLVISFGRLGLGLITALPMFFSWIVTLGFMGLTGLSFNIFNIIISSFIFGLGVDYSILMMRGLQQRLAFGRDELPTFRVSIILSALTTLLGTSALFFARHPALNSIAMVSLIGMIAVVMATFVLEHYLVDQLMLQRARNGRFPVTLMIALKTLVTWGNIVGIAVILMFLGWMIRILPIRKKKKEMLFHHLFSFLSRVYIAVTFGKKSQLINTTGEDFSRPAIIISNHQSLIETPAFLRLHSKMLILTTSWVYRSPVFGPVARLANFFNTDDGLDQILPRLKEKFDEGFSLLIFPEGHRSDDHHIQRFHRGAFYLAEKLKIDLLPMMVFGSGDFLPRGSFWGRPNYLKMKIMPRITWDDTSYGTTYQERAKQMRQWYIREYRAFKHEHGDTSYFRRLVALNYVLKGPVLEWYMRVKMQLERNYEQHHKLIPVKGDILDLGCGYGFTSYMLMLTSDERRITGVDYDPEKIDLASNNFSGSGRIRFICSDVMDFPITPQIGFILGDVLHYLPPDKQDELLEKCFRNLLVGGVILVREADANLESLHKRSKLTEFFSTRSGFNKTQTNDKRLWFTNGHHIEELAEKSGLMAQRVDDNRSTSNGLWLIKHKPINS